MGNELSACAGQHEAEEDDDDYYDPGSGRHSAVVPHKAHARTKLHGHTKATSFHADKRGTRSKLRGVFRGASGRDLFNELQCLDGDVGTGNDATHGQLDARIGTPTAASRRQSNMFAAKHQVRQSTTAFQRMSKRGHEQYKKDQIELAKVAEDARRADVLLERENARLEKHRRRSSFVGLMAAASGDGGTGGRKDKGGEKRSTRSKRSKRSKGDKGDKKERNDETHGAAMLKRLKKESRRREFEARQALRVGNKRGSGRRHGHGGDGVEETVTDALECPKCSLTVRRKDFAAHMETVHGWQEQPEDADPFHTHSDAMSEAASETTGASETDESEDTDGFVDSEDEDAAPARGRLSVERPVSFGEHRSEKTGYVRPSLEIAVEDLKGGRGGGSGSGKAKRLMKVGAAEPTVQGQGTLSSFSSCSTGGLVPLVPLNEAEEEESDDSSSSSGSDGGEVRQRRSVSTTGPARMRGGSRAGGSNRAARAKSAGSPGKQLARNALG